MSTRSKTRAATAASANKYTTPTSAKSTKQTSGKSKALEGSSTNNQPNGIREKENAKAKPGKERVNRGKGKAATPSKDVYCTCSQGDDGSPMVLCSECKIWYHFTCVDLSEPEAEDICLYICLSCTKATGRHTAMTWEGPDALEECNSPTSKPDTRQPSLRPKSLSKGKAPLVDSEDEEDASSEDEYMAGGSPKGKTSSPSVKKRRNYSDSDSDSSASHSHYKRQRRVSKVSASPTPSHQLNPKRKASAPLEALPQNKRKKSNEAVTSTDPVRKYCLGKLEELFRDIFFRSRVEKAQVDGGDTKATNVSKPLDEMTDEEKERLAEESKQFALGLEQCIFEIYSEPDKHGNPHAGGNYKDRFRMLQFNLSKPDRVMIHQRITSGNISPKEISLMSSTDLADEETKQSIIIAEKEALEHSILQKSTVPRSKITHKGLQDIEDINGGTSSTAADLDVQRDRDLEGEERRERERMARLRIVQRQRTTSISVPPESPTVSQTPTSETWGAPPPVPSHILANPVEESNASSLKQPSIPLFIRTSSDIPARYTPEPELNLADFINIDEEPSGPDLSPNTPSMTTPLEKPSADIDPMDRSEDLNSLYISSPTGISPFAARPERARGNSFDLNSLWSGSRGPDEELSGLALPSVSSLSESPPSAEPEIVSNAQTLPSEIEDEDDQDFDMFLADQEQETLPIMPMPVEEASVNHLPQVWTGKISMPLDSSIPQETSLVARQIAGPTLAPESPLWGTLFPSEHLRIDGRVPVDGSAKYLLQMRMNSSKELYGAVLTPSSDGDETGFTALCDFLTAKSRHGLVFPWGNRPKDHHPGRELYIIPLLASSPLPEYMELLDNLKLPKDRQENYLVGIWVLNKGKLAPPPPQAPMVVHPAPASVTLSNLPAVSLHPTGPPIPPTTTPFNPHPTTTPSVLPPTLDLNNLPIEPSALAAEVASLTPEQIQSVIRTLQMAGASFPIPGIPQTTIPSQTPIIQPPPPQPFAPPMQQLPHVPTWHNPAATPPYPAAFPPISQPNRTLNNEADRAPTYNDFDRGDRGNSGWRGRGRGRAGWDRDQRDTPQRPVDSGWPRRLRNDSAGESHDTPRRW